jgi:orotate phosphoribosyltransferase-like protein
MTLLLRAASMHLAGHTRDQIAEQLLLTRQMVDWLMDSDSFQVVLERAGGERS